MEQNNSVKEAIEQITYFNRSFPEEQFQILTEHKEEAIPYLMEGLKKAVTESDNLEDDYQLHWYALYLLAQFEYKAAFPTVLELISQDEDTLDDLLGDLITDGLNNILYALYDGRYDALTSYIINKDVDSMAKSAALNVCVQLFFDGDIQKPELVNLFKKLIYDPVIPDNVLDTQVVGAICDCHFVSMLPDIKFLFKNDRVDEFVHGEYDSCVDLMFAYNNYCQAGCRKIKCAADEIRHWAMFDSPKEDAKSSSQMMKEYEKMLRESKRGMNVIEKKQKIYPNDPCPCGSGKKYKKCCMNKSSEEREDSCMEADRRKWLKEYPKDASERIEGQVYLEDYYDPESIKVDKFVYLALKHREGFITERETEEEMVKRRIYYLRKAFLSYSERCQKDGIHTFREYDEKYAIHYDSADWLNYLMQLLKKQGLKDELKTVKNFCKGR